MTDEELQVAKMEELYQLPVTARTVGILLAEVERLRAELETQRAALATPEGYRGVVSDALADEVERLREENRQLRERWIIR